jgi:transposase
MEYLTIDSKYYCGIDLHSRTMYATVMNKLGEILFRRNMPNDFKIFSEFMRPFLPELAVGVESTYNWYWLSDGCQIAGIPFYLGHAFYMKAIRGNKNKNDRIDSKTIADLMRANMFPPAYAYPAKMRSTRDLLRRRSFYVSLRAGANTHIQSLFSQEAILDVYGWDVKKKKTRRSLCEHAGNPDLALSIESNLDLIDVTDSIVKKLEKQILQQANNHNGPAFDLLKTITGVGDILALTTLYEIHTIGRFKSVQKFSSYCRAIKCQRESNGKGTDSGNSKIGNPYLKWAISQIINKAQTQSPAIERYFEKLKAKHGPRKARGIMTHKFAVTIYYMLKNGQPFDEEKFLQSKIK